jgi:centromeric protein E
MAQSPRKRSAAAQHGAETTINVSVRIRPMNDMEVAMKSEPVWIEHHGNCITEIDTGGETGKQLFYDQVFGPETSTQEVYDKVAVNIIKASLAGYNGTLFAYGQTSSGKTHTLMGSAGEPGFIILAVHDVFNHILTTTNLEFLVRVSYVEIYNDELKDLLQPGQHDLRIVEDKDKGTCVQGMKEVVVTSPEQVLELIAEGESNRHYGETNMNANSSRSHTLFKMVLEMRDVLPHDAAAPEPKRRPDVRWSSIFIVDLAGSERVSKTRASGARLKEGNMINRSLLVLGTVISQLSKGGGGHIPFRDCKLTRLLQTSLGGNARTALVSAVSPAERNRAETISTLQFASRAKTVVNKAKINQLAEEKSLLSKYRNEIQLLKQQLEVCLFAVHYASLILPNRLLHCPHVPRAVDELLARLRIILVVLDELHGFGIELHLRRLRLARHPAPNPRQCTEQSDQLQHILDVLFAACCQGWLKANEA